MFIHKLAAQLQQVPMNIRGFIFSCLTASLLLSSCRENNTPAPPLSPVTEHDQVIPTTIEFTKPALILVQSETDNYRITNPKSVEPFILRANDLQLEIAVIPQAELTFRLKNGKTTVINKESLTENQLIFFNGKEILFTSTDNASLEIFDVFFQDQALADQRMDNNPGLPSAKGIRGKLQGRMSSNSGKVDTYAGESSVNENNRDRINAGILRTTTNYPLAVSRKEAGIGTKYPVIVKDPVIVRNPATQSYIWPYTGVEILLDNDLFSNTDRYYTNGVQIKYRSPALAFWRINSILPVNMKQSMEYNSLELHHGMFTPFTTKVPPLLKGDRPYAATMYLKFNRRADSPEKGISQTASFDIGVMGEAALGSTLQKGVHAGLPTNDEPLGWETQIGNDIIINYNYQLLRHLASSGPVSVYSITSGSLGTLNTSAETGIGIKIGTDKYFLAPLPQNFNNLNRITGSKWHFIFESNFTTRVVGYNATLTGGIMNKNNIYVLKPEEIERLLFTAEAGITVKYSRFGVRLAQYYLSNEFKEGTNHFWGQAGINIGF